MSRFPKPTTTTIPISNGDHIVVKTRVTHGERSEAYSRVYVVADLPDATPADKAKTGDVVVLNRGRLNMAVVLCYLHDWNLTNDDGDRVEICGASLDDKEAILNGLDPESFDEIRNAILAHEGQGKKKPDESSPTFASPESSDGGTSGSTS